MLKSHNPWLNSYQSRCPNFVTLSLNQSIREDEEILCLKKLISSYPAFLIIGLLLISNQLVSAIFLLVKKLLQSKTVDINITHSSQIDCAVLSYAIIIWDVVHARQEGRGAPQRLPRPKEVIPCVESHLDI